MPLPGVDSAIRLKAYGIIRQIAKQLDRMQDVEAVAIATEQVVEEMATYAIEAEVVEALRSVDLARAYRRDCWEIDTDEVFEFTCVGDMDHKRLLWRDYSWEAKEEFEGQVSAWQPMVKIPEQVRPGYLVILARIDGKVSLIGHIAPESQPVPYYCDRVDHARVDSILRTYYGRLRGRELGDVA